MRDLDNVKVILRDDSITDDWLLLHGFKQLWYEYEGKPLCIRLPLVPLAISEQAVVSLYLQDNTHISGVTLGW